MKTSDVIKYYSQPGFREFMLDFSRNREVVPRFRDFLGERPQSFRFDAELVDVIRKGVTSFHFSPEKWSNPMTLSPDLDRPGLDALRTGWDLVFDVDSKHLLYAKACAKLIIDALDFHDVTKPFVKYSGGSGIHIGVSFNSPEVIKGRPVRELFPEAPRIIGLYVQEMIKDYFRDSLLSIDSVSKIAENIKASPSELIFNGVLDPFKVASIDPVAIASRHLLRAPYSLNEKRWRVSVPINPKSVLDFSPDEALPENVVFDKAFLNESCDAKNLFTQAFDWFSKEESKKKDVPKISHEIPRNAVTSNCFPPCINYILGGLPDGRKRGLFALINFYAKCGYSWPNIESLVRKWNLSNKPPLKDGYVKSQIDWSMKTGSLMPPNCNSPNYKDMGVCHPDTLCPKIKNPVTYALHKNKLINKPVRGQKSFNSKKSKENKVSNK